MIDHKFPLIDLHRHLDGSVRIETILDLGREHNIKLPAWDIEELRPYIEVGDAEPGVMAFIARFKWMIGVLVDYDACRRVAYENVEDALREGIDYIELRFSPWFMAQEHHLDPAGIVEAVIDGTASGEREFGVRVNLIGILSRTYGVEDAWQELDALISQKDHLAALDLAGDEINYPPEMFIRHFKKARDAGWQITVHAGESAGPESIWGALNDLGAVRIGHAVTAVQDPILLDYLCEHKIGVECNLTSNIQTSLVKRYSDHPMGGYLDHGILATLNTDDPAISGIDLPHEYNIAAPAAGLTHEDIHKAQRNALEVAFLSPIEKEELRLLKLNTAGDDG